MDIVLNWAAQGGVVALAAAAALRAMPLAPAQARYAVVWGAYLLVLVLPAVPPLAALVVDTPVDVAPSVAGSIVTIPASWWTSSSAALGLWLIWSGVYTVRFSLGARRGCAVRRRSRECPAAALERLPHWRRVRRSGRPARVILSNEVRAAAVLSGGAPTIVLAPALIEQLSAADLDRVLVHEWAHVQRRDDLAQLAQRMVRIVVGWHPASWWLERQLDFEREAACDEAVVRVTGSAKEYAACLANLAARSREWHRSVPALAAAPTPSRLRGRIVRILADEGMAAARSWRAIALCAGGGLLACSLAVGHVRVVAAASNSILVEPPLHQIGNRPDVAALLASHPAVASDVGPSTSVSERPTPGARVAPAVAAVAYSPPAGAAEAIGERTQAIAAPASAPLTASSATVDSLMPLPRETRSPGLVMAADAAAPAPPAADENNNVSDKARQVWTRAANAGIGIGRVSEDAGTATAGFFGRFGKRIANSF